MSEWILAIESSCDETAAAVLCGDNLKSNVIATQTIHEKYGGVVPELASRAHQSNIVPVVAQALKEAGVTLQEIDVIAFTRGPGLMGALLVGTSFAKSLSLALNKPLIGVNHMQAHVLAHFIRDKVQRPVPLFPFLCLTVSGGHTQLIQANSPLEQIVIGATIDDAAGEAFDKAAKLLGLPYPGGPHIDRLAANGDSKKYTFTQPSAGYLNYSFSGLKTSFLYFLRDKELAEPGFKKRELEHICASYQKAVIDYLLSVLEQAVIQTGITDIALAGGVSTNSFLRSQLKEKAALKKWNVFIPPFEYCTDNAAMIGIAAWFMHQAGRHDSLNITPEVRMR